MDPIPTTRIVNAAGAVVIVNTSDVDAWRDRGFKPVGEAAPEPTAAPAQPPAVAPEVQPSTAPKAHDRKAGGR